MRSAFAIALIVTATLSGAYLYQVASAVCPIPITYQLGELDSRFGISPAEANDAIAEAAAVWQAASDQVLFLPAPSADLTINFIFDDRQARTDAEAELREQLDEQGGTTETIAEQYQRLNREYEVLQNSYRQRVAAYEAQLQSYNAEVASYNATGGAPPEIFDELKAQEAALASEMNALERTARELERFVQQLNQLGEEGNQLISEYNEGVAAYNETFGESAEFTQGDYQGDTIQIYKFADQSELVNVLTHEFGHALGIGHVEGEASLMYYLMGEQPDPPVLSAEDQAALVAACGTATGWQLWWHRLLTLYT